MRLKAGVKKDGTLTALHMSGIGTGGAYPAGGTALVDWVVKELYACPNVKTELSGPLYQCGACAPIRAPGHPQGAWALEQMMDALSEKIGMDPVELRLKNIPLYSQARDGNPAVHVNRAARMPRRGGKAHSAGMSCGRRPAEKRKGTSAGAWAWPALSGSLVGGGPPSTVIVKLFSDGSVNLNMGASDIGTGTKTVMAMVVAEELGVKPDVIQIEHADTGTTQYATSSGGSKTVPTESPAVRAAAIAVKQQVLKIASEELKIPATDLTIRDGQVVSLADASKKLKIPDIAGLKRQGLLVGIGYRHPNPPDKITNPFSAQFCEVEVNMKTGEVKILRFLGTNDSGRVMGRLTYDNQVFGGITMGIGLAMTEKRMLDVGQTGKMLNRNWHDYKIPTALDVPADMVSLPIDLPDPAANTTGAKGLGEPVTIPTAPALANAVYNATGVRVTSTPMSPVQLCELFSQTEKAGKGR